MKHLLIAAALLLGPVQAFAGTDVTVSVGTTSETWTLSDTDQQKFEAWVQTAYPCTGNDCLPLTLAESEALWAQAVLRGAADSVTRFQNTVAAAAAVNATTPIGFSVNRTAMKKK